jgi:hypothetical protein
MTPSDKSRFSQIMLGMADNFRDQITKDGMRMRFEMLSCFTIEEVEEAAKKIMATRRYTKMPPIAEFLEALRGPAAPVEDHALNQANKIIENLRLNGARRFPDGLDDTARHLMQTRWPYHRWGTEVIESELKWWIKEFCDSYRARSTSKGRQQIEARPEVLQIAGNIGQKIP